MTETKGTKRSKAVAERPVRKIFTNRQGGVSVGKYRSFNLGDHVGDDPAAVAANRRRLAGVLGLPENRLVWMEQIHSNTVTVVTEELVGQIVPATDAIVTTVPRLALCVVVADCVPVLLSDHQAGVVAAVHAGRPGARNGIVKKTVAQMQQLGANPRNIHALLGPAASGARYEVPEAMAADVEKHLPHSRCRTVQGTVGLDLRAGITRQLLSLGVVAIDCDTRCTIEDKNFFSYRREQKTGRQAGVIWCQ